MICKTRMEFTEYQRWRNAGKPHPPYWKLNMVFGERLASIRWTAILSICFWALLVPAGHASADEADDELGPEGNVPETTAPDEETDEETDEEIDEDADEEEELSGWTTEILAKEEYRFRYAGEPATGQSQLDSGTESSLDLSRGADHDLHFFFSGGLRDLKDRFYFNASLGLFADVDGYVSSGDASSLSSINDNASSVASLVGTSSSAVWLDMYTLYAEYHSRKIVSLARAGRQISEHGKSITFDGAALDLRLFKHYWMLYVLGGRSVHFFETDSELYEDWLGSAGTVIRPTQSLKFEFDYRAHAEDTATDDALLDGDDSAAIVSTVDHSYGLTAWYHHSRDLLYLKGYFRGHDAAVAEVGGNVTFNIYPVELTLDFRADAQLISYQEFNESDNAYFAVLGESLPHVRLNAELKKSFTRDKGIFTLLTGWNARILTEDEPTDFNRDYGRLYLMFDAASTANGPFVSALGEFYYTHAESNRLFTVGGSTGYDGEIARFEAGTYYSWSKFVYYADIQEIEDVRTYYLELKLKPTKNFNIRGKYELEQFDRLIHTAVLTFTQNY